MPSFNNFNLNNALRNALTDIGISEATTIQEKVFTIAMAGRDICGIAQTGTGKTFAYLLPCIMQWKFSAAKNPQILILVPTRELVMQVVNDIKKLCKYNSLVVAGVYGGVNINTQSLALQEGADAIVATPGRLIDLIYNGAIKTKAIKKLVIDEMDEMLNLGFKTQLTQVIELLPVKRQNMLFSATITNDVEILIETLFNNPERIEAAPAGSPLANITQIAYSVPNFYTKVNFLQWLVTNDSSMQKVLVFTATKQMADDIYEALAAQIPERVGVIHSNKEQNNRFNTVNNFQSGNYLFLVATDIVARGIDVAQVTHVINIDIPDTPENYIHRIGRTGRADKKGIAISFVTEQEKAALTNIEALMQQQIILNIMPLDVPISTTLTEEEKPKIFMKIIQPKKKKVEEKGASFHEKSAKNSKVNVKQSRKDVMKKKYKKPIKRGAKK